MSLNTNRMEGDEVVDLPYAKIGERLRARREAGGYSRRRLVEELGREGIRTSVSSLQDLEMGRRFNLRITDGLARILGCRTEELLEIDGKSRTLEEWQRLVEEDGFLAPEEKEILQEALKQIARRRGNEPRVTEN